MSFRISTQQIFGRGVDQMMSLTNKVNDTQQQIASGKRILTPADDPIASTRVMQLDHEIALTEQYEVNSTYITARLELEEGILANVEQSISRIRELTVASGNAALTKDDRQAIALEIRQRAEELLTNMNSKDSTGEYIFAGFNTQQQPFERNAGGGFDYKGDQGQRFLQVASTTKVASSDSGQAVFMDINAVNNTFTAFASENNKANPPAVISQGMTVDQEKLDELFPDDAIIEFNNELDVDPPATNFTVRRRSDGHVIDGLSNMLLSENVSFEISGMQVSINGRPEAGDSFVVQTSNKQGALTTFEKLAYGLENIADNQPGRLNNLISDTLNNLDFTSANISETRSQIGARLNTIESTENLHAELKLVAQEVRSKLSDVDYAEAISQLQMQSFVLEASQQSYVKVSGLSLFDFIR